VQGLMHDQDESAKELSCKLHLPASATKPRLLVKWTGQLSSQNQFRTYKNDLFCAESKPYKKQHKHAGTNVG
jgi:hypothetical protein